MYESTRIHGSAITQNQAIRQLSTELCLERNRRDTIRKQVLFLQLIFLRYS